MSKHTKKHLLQAPHTLLIIFFLTLTSCSKENPSNYSEQAEAYLNEVLDIMEGNSIHKNEINWTDFRAVVFNEVTNAKTIQDTYPAITKALTLLNDNHSHYLKSNGSLIFVGTLTCRRDNISNPSYPSNVGFVRVDSFTGSTNSEEAALYAEEVQEQIQVQDREDLSGWIIDLRNNGGGNMYPMLAGIAPILGEGTTGYFINGDGDQTSWGIYNGAVTYNDNEVFKLENPYELKTPKPRVAVLINNGVASSGEVIAISFIGRESTKSFGISTCGLSTSNRRFQLSDNATLNLTTSYLADRNGQKYGTPIIPDIETDSNGALQAAIEWLTNQ